MSRSLAVDADLTLSHDGEEIAVWTDDAETLVVAAPSCAAARALVTAVTASPTPPAELFGVATSAGDAGSGVDSGSDGLLDRHGLTVEIRVRGAAVASFGSGVSPAGWRRRLAEHLLGVPAAVRVRGAVVATARRVG